MPCDTPAASYNPALERLEASLDYFAARRLLAGCAAGGLDHLHPICSLFLLRDLARMLDVPRVHALGLAEWGHFLRHADAKHYAPGLSVPAPTSALPASSRKLAVLAGRAAAGVSLFAPGDARCSDGGGRDVLDGDSAERRGWVAGPGGDLLPVRERAEGLLDEAGQPVRRAAKVLRTVRPAKVVRASLPDCR